MESALTPEELRVLACLIEKSFTTPDQYPLTTNSLTNACNQKTSRDPVVDYSTQLVDNTMLELRQGGWARSIRGTGNRAFKHKHVINEKLGLSNSEMAVMAVLALRGPQSPGELRTRTERFATFSSDGDEAFTAVEQTLTGLAERETPLVRNVGRVSGQSQDRWIQLIGGTTTDGGSNHAVVPNSDAELHEPMSAAAALAKPVTVSAAAPTTNEMAEIRDRLAQLEQRVADLEELL